MLLLCKELERTVANVAAPMQTKMSDEQVDQAAPIQQSSELVVNKDPPGVITEVRFSSAVSYQPDIVEVVNVKAEESVTQTSINSGDRLERAKRNSQCMDYESNPPTLNSQQLGEGNNPASFAGSSKGTEPNLNLNPVDSPPQEIKEDGEV